MDNKIIKKIKDRDKAGLKLLINNYSKNVNYIVITILGNSEDKRHIDECVSDALLNIWNDIYEIDREKITLKTFILKKSKETALEYKAKLHNKTYNINPRDKVKLTEESDIKKSQEIVSIIKSFKNPDKTYFYLNHIMNYDIETIAKEYGDSISSVQNILCRCSLKLKNIMEKEVIIDGK